MKLKDDDITIINNMAGEIWAEGIYKFSIEMARIINKIDDMARFNWNAITNNPTEYEFIMENRDNFIRALRVISTALDRSVVIKCQEDD